MTSGPAGHPDPRDPGLGLAPAQAPGLAQPDWVASLASSWRVWRGPAGGLFGRPEPRVPELYTVQVWHYGQPGMTRKHGFWRVWVYSHWVPHWSAVQGIRGTALEDTYPSLQAATRRAWGATLTLGGRRWAGEHALACDAELPAPERDRWTRWPVDPPPPWAASWPGPQGWRAQLAPG